MEKSEDKKSLIKKIAIYTFVGFGSLIMGSVVLKEADNIFLKRSRYNKAYSIVMQSADLDNRNGVDEKEWRAVKTEIGIDPRSSDKLKLRELETYLSNRGFYWNGNLYVQRGRLR